MQGSKILIVDDEPINISLCAEMLKMDDHIILRAGDGIEAVRQAEAEVPDLIIMDWNMPRMDGLGALKIIKQRDKTKDIQVIMITGIMTSFENLMTALQEGAFDFLRKPFDKIELKARVHSTLLYSVVSRELQEKFRDLELSNQFIRSLIEGVPHPIVYYSADGIIAACNRLFSEFAGKTESDLTGKLVYLQYTGTIEPVHLQTDREIILSGQRMTYESNLGQTDREYLLSKNPSFAADGSLRGIICVITDVTEIKKAHRELMEIRKKELVSSSLHLIQMAELNNSLIGELNEVKSHATKKGSALIHQIINSYRINSTENVWKDFETHFNNVYELFYQRLHNKFPELTHGERKLCAMLRLNLSTKDIAAITFQNPNSIDVARYRLRKKLNLGLDDSLVDFLTDIES